MVPNFNPANVAPLSSGSTGHAGHPLQPARYSLRRHVHLPDGHASTASTNIFNITEFARRLRDFRSVMRDLPLGSPRVRLSASLLGVRINEVGRALMTEESDTPTL